MTAVAAEAGRAQNARRISMSMGYEWSLALFEVLGIVVLSMTTAGAFLRVTNLRALLVDIATIALPGAGMTLVIASAGIDVSIGSLLGLVAVVAGMLFEHNVPVIVVLGVAAVVGGLGGVVNGTLITKLRLPPIIVTLGMLSIWRSMVFALLGGNWISSIPLSLTSLTVLDGLGFLPYSFVFAIADVLLFSYISRKRHIGRVIYAIGSNNEAARVSGLPVQRAIMFAYCSLGVLTAIAAMMTLGQSTLVQANTGSGFELSVIAAVVVGGTSILGGTGSVMGSVLGAVLVELVQDAVVLYRVQPFWQGVVLGGIILVAVSVGLAKKSQR